MSKRSEYIAEIERLTLSLEANTRQAFLQSVQNMQDVQALGVVAHLIEQGSIAAVVALYTGATIATAYQPLLASVNAAYIESGLTISSITPPLSARPALSELISSPIPSGQLQEIKVVFNAVDDYAINSMKTQRLDLITNLEEQTSLVVRETLSEGIRIGNSPIDIARQIRQHIGLSAPQLKAVQNYRNALLAGDTHALDYQLRDRRFDSSVANGKLTNDRINTMVDRYIARALKQRSEVIAMTEVGRAKEASNLDMWRITIRDSKLDEQRVTRYWITARDGHVRESHVSIPRLNPDGVKGLNSYFQSSLGRIKYPCDPDAPAANTVRCRCHVFISYE